MDEERAQADILELQDRLARTASKSKNQKVKADELCITFQDLKDFPYVMQQSAWELDWDCVKGLYDFCLSILAYIFDDAILDQWSPMASSLDPQSWTNCDAEDLLYRHAVLLSLAQLNLLDPVTEREQDKQGTGLKQYIYSAVVVFIHPHPDPYYNF